MKELRAWLLIVVCILCVVHIARTLIDFFGVTHAQPSRIHAR